MADASRIHRDTIIALLNDALTVEQQAGAYRVYDGDVTTAEDQIAYPYLVVWSAPADRPNVTMAGRNRRALTTTQITAAGTSTDEVLAALDRAGDALIGRVPPSGSTGRLFGRIFQQPGTSSPLPRKDPSVRTREGLPVYVSSIVVTLYSTPQST